MARRAPAKPKKLPYPDPAEAHERFVAKGKALFPGSTDPMGFEDSRNRVFAMLRQANKDKQPEERWVSACRVFHDLHLANNKPHSEWAARVLNEDLAAMLAALHGAGLAESYTTPWPDQWA